MHGQGPEPLLQSAPPLSRGSSRPRGWEKLPSIPQQLGQVREWDTSLLRTLASQQSGGFVIFFKPQKPVRSLSSKMSLRTLVSV